MAAAKKEWSSSFGFIIASVGSAVGLGNIWKFPYIAYENGGGAFVFMYLFAIAVAAFPIVIAEMILGRNTGLSAFGAFKKLAKNNLFWKGVGVLCIYSAFSILSYYSVVAGWTLEYFFHSLIGSLRELTTATAEPRFVEFVGSGGKQLFFHTLFMTITATIVLRGTSGIEKAVKILMPILAIIIFVIAGVSLSTYGASDTLNFLFSFDISKLGPSSMLEAVGHAFFTLSLGLGTLVVYGSYLPKSVSLVKAAIWITILDTLVAILACFMMYPIIFGTGMDIKESVAILFTTLTVQFNMMPGGSFIAALFYLLVAFAAVTSTISLLEPVVAFVTETFNMKRIKATLLTAFSIWFLGLGSALGNGAVGWLTDLKFMDRLDYFSSNWSLPLGGLFISIFVGWFVNKKVKLSELSGWEQRSFYSIWNFFIRYVSPLLIIVVMLHMLGVFS